MLCPKASNDSYFSAVTINDKCLPLVGYLKTSITKLFIQLDEWKKKKSVCAIGTVGNVSLLANGM